MKNRLTIVIVIGVYFFSSSSLGQIASNSGHNITDYDFQTIKNYILLNPETRKIIDPDKDCLYYSLYSSLLSITLELTSNCKDWNAIRVAIMDGGEAIYDYYLNQQYDQESKNSKTSILITSSFGLKTDSASVVNFRNVLHEIKSSILTQQYLNRFVNYVNEREGKAKLVKNFASSTVQTVINGGTIEIVPTSNKITAYQILLESDNNGISNSFTSINTSNFAIPVLNAQMSSMYFCHFTSLFLDLQAESIARIR